MTSIRSIGLAAIAGLILVGQASAPATAGQFDIKFKKKHYNDGYHYENVHTPRINQRIQNQRQRIRKGVRIGDLTRPQARRLRERLADIRDAKRQFARDGHISWRERRRLRRMLRRNSRRIAMARHGIRVWRYDLSF